jgi:hypothetical protein
MKGPAGALAHEAYAHVWVEWERWLKAFEGGAEDGGCDVGARSNAQEAERPVGARPMEDDKMEHAYVVHAFERTLASDPRVDRRRHQPVVLHMRRDK